MSFKGFSKVILKDWKLKEIKLILHTRIQIKSNQILHTRIQIKYKNLEKYCLIDFQTNVSEFSYGPLV